MSDPIVVACSCESSMPVDASAIRAACPGAKLQTADALCRRQFALFEALLEETDRLVVGCAQEAPLFAAAAQEAGYEGALAFRNLRETAGWSDQAADAGPKMGALLASGLEPDHPLRAHEATSEGVVLVLGRDETAVTVGRALADTLDVTVLVTGEAPIAPPRIVDFPIARGAVVAAKGALGGFELSVDGFARPRPSSRATLTWGEARDGALSRCDILVDVSGGRALFEAPDLRVGYLRADPAHPSQVEKAIREALALVGSFDKQQAIDFRADLCAHARNRKVGCRRCLDLCPTGAIQPAGDHVAIDPMICAGCGQCASACPTGAAGYDLPPADVLMRRLRRAILGYSAAGGADALVLLHDKRHGAELIDALARFGPGLPAYALPFEVEETTQIGPETILSALAWGATGVALLTRARPRHDTRGLAQTAALCDAIAAGLGFGAGIVRVLGFDDPDALRAALDEFPPGDASKAPARFEPRGRKRDLLNVVLTEIQAAAPAPQACVALAEGAPIGGIALDLSACTLCLSCVAACPTGALADHAERPELTFDETLCVQCGLCAATCPEKAVALTPRLDFEARAAGRKTLKREDPALCVACGAPFGAKSSVDKVAAKLADHWMYRDDPSRLEMIRMCEACRVERSVKAGLDPHDAPPRPRPRTTEDYLRERAAGLDGLGDA
ncbi:MAG: 4Fe-4S binding protein [Rhodoblastus sp.]|nr:MAG: 4Fe-4S binding protein [Rhodoblastus sp.]